MRFLIEQHVPAKPEAVAAALVDPDFLSHLASLPKLGGGELVDQRTNGEVVVQRVRYRFTGAIDGPAKRFIEADRLTWIEESSHHLTRHTSIFKIVPDHYASLLECSGSSRIERSAQGSWRRVEGELRVKVPIVGGKAERAILSGLEEHGRAEADILAAWLATR